MRALLVVVLALLLPGASLSAKPMCTAHSGAIAPWVVEFLPACGSLVEQCERSPQLMSLAAGC